MQPPCTALFILPITAYYLMRLVLLTLLTYIISQVRMRDQGEY